MLYKELFRESEIPTIVIQDFDDPFTCPNSEDCVMGHRELKLTHVRWCHQYAALHRTLKALLGILFIAWFAVFETGVHDNELSHGTPHPHYAHYPTPRQGRLAPVLTAIAFVALVAAAAGACSCWYGVRMRSVERIHTGVEVWTRIPWWVDSPVINWILLVACCTLVYITTGLGQKWSITPPQESTAADLISGNMAPVL
ncbi:hypothetical protein DRE_01582 [Drechslerella stenobrocha 248]|uniref:Uncharacterized protein n=1 Tax=Drechslerella stenobrocha 248 TaxID=1043628 RepID=W7I4M8_9PEZI|nr:hypothetical protein DRE_01582 [Drechslerella stenobrocha 248]